ncbi:MAG: hypothetical protein K6D94_01555 [Clostridiales bacterium]|nr:hypothetical protein [Clostridiales bacterium]
MKKTLIPILLIILMLAAACGETSGNSAAETTAARVDAEETTTEPEIAADLPDADYGGADFTMCMRIADGYALDFDVKELTGDTIDDAVFERNSRVAEQFNIKFVFVRDNDNFGLDSARKTVYAGDSTYDVLIPHARFVFPYALEGMLFNWNDELPYIDLDKPWWNDDARAAFSLCGQLFAMVGDISYLNLGSTKCMIFNKPITEKLGFDTPYAAVTEGKWTLDRLEEYMKAASADLNGDGEIKITDDQYGYITTHWGGPIQALYAANQRIARKDENDLLYITLNTEIAISLYEKYFYLVDNEGGYINLQDDSTDMINCFRNGRALFYDPGINGIKSLRDMEDDFGIIPWPKFDESIDNYYAAVDAGCNLFIVPVTCSDAERASIILEACAYEGWKTVLPTYYDIVLTTKFTRDQESEKMIDIIRAGRVFDIGYYFYNNSNDLNSFGWFLAHDESHNFASIYAKYEKTVQKQYDEVNEKFLSLDS